MMKFLGSLVLLTCFAFSAMASPPPPEDNPPTSSVDITLFLSPSAKRSVDKSFVDFDQLVSTNNPQVTMFGTNPAPANNYFTFDAADVRCDLTVGGTKNAVDRSNHIIRRIEALVNQDGSAAGLQVGISGYYGTYRIPADRETAILNNFNSFHHGSYRAKYNTVGAKRAIAQQKANVAAEALLSCSVFPGDSTSEQRNAALSDLTTKTTALAAANAELLTALNNAVSTANSLRSSSASASYPDGLNGFGGDSLEKIWVAQSMLYWYYIDWDYLDRGHWFTNSNNEQEFSGGWPYGTPVTSQPSTWLAQQNTVDQWYQLVQPAGGITPWRWMNGED